MKKLQLQDNDFTRPQTDPAPILSSPPNYNFQTQNHIPMIKHVVTFKFKGSQEERKEIATKFAEALVQLPCEIPELKSMEVGININPAETWDLVLTATADSLEDVATYSAHPAHQEAVAIIAPYKESRACVDYMV